MTASLDRLALGIRLGPQLLLASLLLVALFSSGQLPAQEPDKAQGKVLRAGAAASNITPRLGEPIVGGWSSPPAEHIHDELYARCLVLDDGSTRLAIVLCDNVGITRDVYDHAKEMIERETGIAPSHVLAAATHTHSATSARGRNRLVPAETLSEYQEFLARRIADGVRRAIHNLEPARIGWGSVDEPSEVFNRRWYMTPGAHLTNPFGGLDQVQMNPPRGDARLIEPAGPIDPEVSFISVQSADGRPIALLANYSLHYVGGTGGAVVSADYFGVFADRIQELLGADRLDPPFVGIMSNGTSGDVNNIDFRQPAEERLPPYEKMRRVAHKIAARVHEAHQQIEFHDWVSLDAAQQDLVLAVRKPTAEQLAWARKIQEQPEGARPRHPRERIYSERVLLQHESPDEVSIPLQTLRIGEVGIAAIPFEVFAETGLELKAKSPLKQTFTIELANGSYGYLPTPRQHALGGYETWLGTSLVEIEASTKIVRTLLELFERVEEPAAE